MRSGRKWKAISSSAPVPCARCRQLFNSSAVVGSHRTKAPMRLTCPLCVRELKAEKKRKKQGDNPT